MTAAKELAKAMRGLAHRHAPHRIFSDFIEMSAIALSNAVDKPQYEQREKRYMDIVGQYKHEEVQQFPKMLGTLVNGLEDAPSDILGATFHELELHNTYKGQFFTPYSLARMMGAMTFDDGAKGIIEEKGFIRASEPACGAGAMIIALAEAMKSRDINYQQTLHVTAVDLDIRCVHMAYVQFSLLHIPAVVVHGNTLSMEEFGHWYTPAHIMGAWDYRLKKTQPEKKLESMIEEVAEVTKPEPAQEKAVLEPFNPGAQLTLF